MSVVGFTGNRTGPTPQDLDVFHSAIDAMCAKLKEDGVAAYALTWVAKRDGTHYTHNDWSKLPGCGEHELIGASVYLTHDLVHANPEVVIPTEKGPNQ